ncbi:AAA family ATPase [Salmonella enterica]|uniref:AAA family ATPase n=2 Tax=Salmonella enterica TaxID=28901 RepID=A0A629K825_SALER|nr:ATPase [Salmonella enterica subsp. enterica serovar Java]EAN9728496.1 ATPase [Salmonella enterica]EBV8393830.1 ATPase [Salmonella enterica subsp. enterica serovar Virchow]ECW9805349.1 AAA family ATPase [Salmonella enterica subsp. enterica serovar Poona]EDV9614970.1 AAA family ATPase [Salmonella enterica subsp. enterica serovar Paratyphi B]EEM8442440.1 AAA family ATPase [Salmonella enterica subsp. enterica serovar Oranienburg]EFV0933827.1 AAA family ATPase [Salmonella enterica subsp. enteri
MDIITQLKDVMDAHGYSQGQVARAIGRSSATMNQYLQGKYNGDIADMEERIGHFLRRVREKQNALRIDERFVSTPTASKGLEVLSYAHLESEICVLFGAAGLGKTMILKEYARRDSNVIFIEADPGFTARTLLEELCSRLRLSKNGNIHALIEVCVEKLKDSGRLLVIDEAELLPYRALEVIRRLHDKAGIGVVLAGMPRLIVNLKGKRGEYAQLYSRVALALDLGNALARQDFDQIALDLMPEAEDQKVSDALYEQSKGNARRLFKMARGVYRMCDISKKDVTVTAIEKFSEMLIH